jgi:uncharacterized protein (DUF302 family)
MNYYFSTTAHGSFDETIEKTIEVLDQEGFGIISDIDVQATMKKKLDIDFRRYRILGACNPPFAHKALEAENKIGLLLPCNVIVQEIKPDLIEIAAIDPMAMLGVANKPQMKEVAAEIRDKLEKAIKRL